LIVHSSLDKRINAFKKKLLGHDLPLGFAIHFVDDDDDDVAIPNNGVVKNHYYILYPTK
jgi:hypothetical protein